MPLVELSFLPRPVHVRTARQIAVAMARRAELTEEVLEEIRLAVSEACGLAVAVSDPAQPNHQVAVDFDDTDGLTIAVRLPVPLEPATGDAARKVLVDAARVDSGGNGLPAGAALAVVAELTPALEVTTSAQGLRLAMRWTQTPISGTGQVRPDSTA